ncbi:MAG: DUF1670 domain-containing protein [Caldilineaceae bacterium]
MTALERLTQRNFITPRSGRYGMSHDQIRQIVYAQIDAATKQQLHGQIGEGLAAGQRADAATLAYHFAHGHRWAAAVTHYTAAGQAATAVAAYTAAVEFYTAALAAAEETTYAAADRFDLLAAREAALATLGNREAQWADIETMAELATTPQQQSLVQRRRFWAQLDTAALDEAEASAQNALSLAKASGDQAAIGASLVAVGTALDRRSHSAAAVPYLQEAVALYQQLGDPNSEAQARVELANALTATADYNAALPELERAHGLYQQTDDRAGAARALSRLGALQMERGAREEAAACFAQALAIAQAIGYQRVEVTTLVNWANLHYAQNQIGDFLACNERALALLGAARAHGQAFIRVNMASVRHSLLGDHVTAQRDAEAALAQFCELGDRGGEAQCLEVLCNIAMVDGKYQEAQSHVERAHAAVNAAGDRWMAVFVHAAQATLARHQRQPAVGLAAIAAAETLCNQFGMADLLVPLQSIQATLLLQTGERAQAATLARQTFAMLNPSVQQGHKVAYECYQTLMACGCPAEATAALTYAHAELERALAGLTPEQRRTSLRHVPEHAAIVQQWQATHAATQQVHLVRADVPTGRPVADDEWVAVSLTVSHPDDQAVQGKKARRQQQLARILQEAAAQNAAPTVEDLSGLLDAGKATIKRDLAELRAAGFEVKTRGSREG